MAIPILDHYWYMGIFGVCTGLSSQLARQLPVKKQVGTLPERTNLPAPNSDVSLHRSQPIPRQRLVSIPKKTGDGTKSIARFRLFYSNASELLAVKRCSLLGKSGTVIICKSLHCVEDRILVEVSFLDHVVLSTTGQPLVVPVGSQ